MPETNKETNAMRSDTGGEYHPYEFLYRFRAPGDPTPAGYHVVLAHTIPGVFGGEPHTTYSLPLTAEQAASFGFDISALVEGINAEQLAISKSLSEELKDHKEKLATEQNERRAHADALAHTRKSLSVATSAIEQAVGDAHVTDDMEHAEVRRRHHALVGSIRRHVRKANGPVSPEDRQAGNVT